MSDRDKIVSLVAKPKDSREVNADAIELVEGTLERLRSGEIVAVAIVEVLDDGGVGTYWSKNNHYHRLNSGAARLAARMALD